MSKSSLPNYYTQKLKNGLEIVAIPLRNGTGVVSIDIFYKVGSRNEVMGKTGIAHMLEHLNFKSTKNMKAGEFDHIVKGFGGVNNASTSFDYTQYFIKSTPANLDESLSLFSDMMENLLLLDEEFQPERDVVAEERRWRTDNNPTGYLYYRLFNNAYIYHPYHWTPIGFSDDIANWSIGDIKKFHRTYYTPNNAVVVISGDIDQNAVFEATQKAFEHIKPGSDPIPPVYTKEPEQDGAKRIIVHKESEVDMIAIAYHIPPYDHEDIIPLSAISEILSSGKSSRFQDVLVDQKQLVNQIYAYNMDLKDPGLFLILAVCNPGVHAETVESEILAQLDKLKEGKILEEEIEKIKINTKADFIYGMESSSNVSSTFGSYFVRGNIEPLMKYEENIEKLTRESVTKAANRYFKPKNSTTLILRKEQKAEDEE